MSDKCSRCPVEDDRLVLGDKKPLITGSESHTVFIKVWAIDRPPRCYFASSEFVFSEFHPILTFSSKKSKPVFSFWGPLWHFDILCFLNSIRFWGLDTFSSQNSNRVFLFWRPLWHFSSSHNSIWLSHLRDHFQTLTLSGPLTFFIFRIPSDFPTLGTTSTGTTCPSRSASTTSPTQALVSATYFAAVQLYRFFSYASSSTLHPRQ